MTDVTKRMLRQLLALPVEQQAKEFAEIDVFLQKCEKYGTSFLGFFEPDTVRAGQLFHRIKKSKMQPENE